MVGKELASFQHPGRFTGLLKAHDVAGWVSVHSSKNLTMDLHVNKYRPWEDAIQE
jgi:hypothetical protein